MGGDCIGSSLVELSTGIDFVRAVIEIALGKKARFEETAQWEKRRQSGLIF